MSTRIPSKIVPLLHDLSHPEYDSPECPDWLKENHPQWVLPFVGINGMPEPLRVTYRQPNATAVAGIDRYQANHFIVHRAETADYLANGYTPLEVHWPEWFQPTIATLARETTAHLTGVEEKAQALLQTVCPRLLHPWKPPTGDRVPGDRNLDEEAIWASGTAWCNEQARMFVRLCQSIGIPARLIHLFYQQYPSGHTVVEFHNGSQWCLADATYYVFFRGNDGRLLSAAQCHEEAEARATHDRIYQECARELLQFCEKLRAARSDDPLLSDWESSFARIISGTNMSLHTFGVINHPLPG